MDNATSIMQGASELPPELRLEIADYAVELRDQVHRYLPELERAYEMLFIRLINNMHIGANEIRMADNFVDRMKRTLLYGSDPEFRRNVNELGKLSNYAAGVVWSNGVQSHNIFINEVVERLADTGNVYINYGPDFYGGYSYLDRPGPPRLTEQQRRGLNGLVEEFERITKRVDRNTLRASIPDELMSDMVTLYLYKYVLMIIFSSAATFDTVNKLADQAVRVLGYEYISNMNDRAVLNNAMRPRGAGNFGLSPMSDFLRDYRAEMEDMILTMKSIAISEAGGYERY